MANKMFIVVDKSGREFNLEEIKDRLRKDLTFVRTNELDFAVGQYGDLYILDGCGNYVPCPVKLEVKASVIRENP